MSKKIPFHSATRFVYFPSKIFLQKSSAKIFLQKISFKKQVLVVCIVGLVAEALLYLEGSRVLHGRSYIDSIRNRKSQGGKFFLKYVELYYIGSHPSHVGYSQPTNATVDNTADQSCKMAYFDILEKIQYFEIFIKSFVKFSYHVFKKLRFPYNCPISEL